MARTSSRRATRITGKQRSARKRNIKIAQAAGKKGASRGKQVKTLKKSGIFKPKDLKMKKLFKSSSPKPTARQKKTVGFGTTQKLYAAGRRKHGPPKNFKYR